MDKNKKSKRASFSFCLVLFLSLFLYQGALAKIGHSTYVKLTLENKPAIGETAILKIVVSDLTGLVNTKIACFLPLELINSKDYKIIYDHPNAEKGEYYMLFYSGTMEAGEKKNLSLKSVFLMGGDI